MQVLFILTWTASFIIFLFSIWAVFFAEGFKDKILIKKGFIALAFGSYAFCAHPSENAKSLIIMALAVICLLRLWDYKQEIYSLAKSKIHNFHIA